MSLERTRLIEAPQETKRTTAIVNSQLTASTARDGRPIESELEPKGTWRGNVDGPGLATATSGQQRSQVTRNVIKAETAATCLVNGGKLQHETSGEKEEEEEARRVSNQLNGYNRPQKYCSVCGDKAIACNFNAVTCESCKAFFRRNAFKEQRLRCLFDNRCVIDRVTRRFCSKCRLLKCIAAGMKREWILTDEQKQIKRVKIMQNKQARGQQQQEQTPVDFETGSEATTPASTRPTRPSSITSLLGGGGGGGDLQLSGDTKRPLGTSGDDCMIDAQSEPPRLKHQVVAPVERLDAATDCPERELELARRDGHLLHFCTYAHQCRFCSFKLTETTTTTVMTTTSSPLIPGAHPYLQLHQQPPLLPNHVASHSAADAAAAAAAAAYQYPHYSQTAGHTPTSFYPPPPEIVHHVGVSRHRHPQVAPLAPPPLQYQARHDPASVKPAQNCCLDSATWMQQPNTTRSGDTSLRHLHVLEPTSKTGGCDSRQQAATRAVCIVACDDQQSRQLTADHLPGVGVAAADTPTRPPEVEPGAVGDGEEEGGGGSEEREEEEEHSGKEGSEESGESEVGERQQAVEQVGKTSEALACDIEQQQQQPPPQQHQEWRGETYCAPVATEPEIRARVERLGFSDTERQLIQELIEATRLVFEPQERMSNDTILDDLVFFCDAALRRLIKTVKQVSSFRVLNMDDQIVLLKNACFKILLLRSSFHYVDEIEGWRDKSGCVLPLSKLKTEKCRNYEKHKAIMDKLAVPLRRDRLLMAFMILIILFDPTVHLKHANSVRLDNMLYLYTLRKYLLGTQPEPLAKYERIVETLDVINACNEEYNLFFSRNYQPEEITPLLVEIFDISINDIPM